VLEAREPARVLGVEPSAGFLAHAARGVRGAWLAAADAQALPLAGACVDAVVSGLVLNFVPDPGRAVREALRVTRPGGTVAAYVWDYAHGMQLLRLFWEAAVAVDPGAAGEAEGVRFGVCHPDPLRALFAGARDVRVDAVDVPTPFPSFEDLWSPFLGGTGPAPAYATRLPESRREALREALRARLPVQADGTVPLTARAWAVSGRV
jgi:SAM-dependent methyltransferase